MDIQNFVNFRGVEEFPGWQKMRQFIEELIEQHDLKNILEVGAGANPCLEASVVMDRSLKYTISDVDISEIGKADGIYKKIILDLCEKDCTYETFFDIIFSRMAAEHFYSGKNFHKNVCKILKPGGISVHCFSTLYS
ncbi:MAG TPA: methyltransferase domain-containing protein, partial [Ignavibacteriaceae bacterium]